MEPHAPHHVASQEQADGNTRHTPLQAELLDVINKAESWSVRLNNDGLQLSPMSSKYPYLAYNSFNMADFSVVDARLPSAITEMLCVLNECRTLVNPIRSFFNQYIRDVLQFWSNAHVVLPAGTMKAAPDTLTHVSELMDVTLFLKERLVDISFMAYVIKTTDDGIPFSFYEQPENRRLPGHWLDRHYPGWENRLMTAVALDISTVDALRLILDNPVLSPSLAPPMDIGQSA